MTIPLCTFCKHYQGDAKVIRCTAFPASIPETFMSGQAWHTQPYPGDGGIRFEPDEATLKYRLVPDELLPVAAS